MTATTPAPSATLDVVPTTASPTAHTPRPPVRRTLVRFLARRHRVSLPLLLLVPVVVGIVSGLIYPEVRPQRELIESIPFISQMMQTGRVSAFSPEAIFSFPFQHPLSLILYVVFPAVPIIGLLAGERGRGGLQLLLATPVERRSIVDAAALFLLLSLPALGLSPLLGAYLGSAVSGEAANLAWPRFGLVMLNTMALAAFWGGLALLLSVTARDRGVASIRLGCFVVVAFALDSAARLTPTLDYLGRWTPFGHLRPADVVGGSPEWLPATLGLATLAALLTLVARELEHRRRDA